MTTSEQHLSTAAGDSGESITLAEAAAIVDSAGARKYGSVGTLRRHIKEGRLPATKENRAYRVRVADLDLLTLDADTLRVRQWAQTAAAMAPPIDDERRTLILGILDCSVV